MSWVIFTPACLPACLVTGNYNWTLRRLRGGADGVFRGDRTSGGICSTSVSVQPTGLDGVDTGLLGRTVETVESQEQKQFKLGLEKCSQSMQCNVTNF